jgi:glycosyltransferase involved in cell wall biosynthesis
MEKTDATTSVTIGIPLYRSRRFVDSILRNVRAIDYPRVDILISDRHHDDDAIDLLAEALKDDGRVTILRATDRIGWVDHFNALLQAASGDYFMWMLHDDQYPAGLVGKLAACLDAHPDVVAACPRGIRVGAAGNVVGRARADLPDDGSPAQAALRMLTTQRVSPVHALLRRQVLASAGLSIRHTAGDVDADMYWTYGVRLCGRVMRVPDCSFTKLMHPESESASWRTRSLAHVRDGFVLPWSYARDLTNGPREAAVSYAGITAWGACRAVGWLTRDWRWFPKTGAKRLVSRLLTGHG